MKQVNLDQYATLKAKKSLSTEEQAVLNAIVEASNQEGIVAATVSPVPQPLAEANDVLEDAQEDLTAKPSTTV